MEGFVKITPDKEVITLLKAHRKLCDDFISKMETIPQGEWKTRSTWFGFGSKEVWSIHRPKDNEVPKGVEVKSYLRVLNTDRFAMYFEVTPSTAYNWAVTTTSYYHNINKIINLAECNDDIYLGDVLVGIYNKFKSDFNDWSDMKNRLGELV